MADLLKADIFLNGNLYKRDVMLPIRYVNGGVDLTSLAASQIPHILFPRLRVFSAKTAPKSIPWFSISDQPAQKRFSAQEIKELQKGYVALGIHAERDLSCLICNKKALFANPHFMEPFCSEACHLVFLDKAIK